MRCQWQAFIKILPQWLQEPVDRLGREQLTELRLRVGQAPQLVIMTRSLRLERTVSSEDISFSINAASRYSPWSAQSASSGYITAPGGHRLGLCGDAVLSEGKCSGFRTVTSLCIRVARDISDICGTLQSIDGSILLIGPPGSGKTTLLRDLIRSRSEKEQRSIAVLDERGEIFPFEQGKPCFPTGHRTDVLTGCNKADGITMLIRCMSPDVIAVDEITAPEDCTALIHAGWCGVRLIATAHAASKEELFRRTVYKPLLEARLFEWLVTLHQDKSWKLERMEL